MDLLECSLWEYAEDVGRRKDGQTSGHTRRCSRVMVPISSPHPSLQFHKPPPTSMEEEGLSRKWINGYLQGKGWVVEINFQSHSRSILGPIGISEID